MGSFLTVKGAKATASHLSGIGTRAKDATIAMMEVRQLLERANRQGFDSQGASFGEPWPKLADSTLKQKLRQGQSSDILVASGRLRASLRGIEVGRSWASAGTSDPVAKYHQGGHNHEPRRRLVGIPAQTEAEALVLIRRWLIKR
jgi:phage virion morphogenesis protein